MINLCCLLIFIILCKVEKRKPGLYLQQPENILALNLQLFSQQIDKKYTLVK